MNLNERRWNYELQAMVESVHPEGRCQRCQKRKVTREVTGGILRDGSDWWEMFLCSQCVRALEGIEARNAAKVESRIDAAQADLVWWME